MEACLVSSSGRLHLLYLTAGLSHTQYVHFPGNALIGVGLGQSSGQRPGHCCRHWHPGLQVDMQSMPPSPCWQPWPKPDWPSVPISG